MKKGRLVIVFFIMTLGNDFILQGQTADSIFILSPSYHPISPLVVNPFPAIPRPIGWSGDTLYHPIGLLNDNYGKRIVTVTIDSDWSYITFTETLDGEIIRVPFSAPVEWYFRKNMYINRHLKFIEIVSLGEESRGRDSKRKSQTLEVVGVELGKLGRASLRVRGNVNISGKMVFQDQELVRSSINETQSTHIEFDQKQNFNIEGKVGDRVSVFMDQDSERDFDFENNIRISYEGAEDDILQKMEAGNISLSLPSTQYVTFSGTNKGLYGLKAISQLGPVDITTIASIEQTKKEQQAWEGGSQSQTQRIKDYDYVKNQYFFIHEWFRNGTPDTVQYVIQPSFFPLINGLHRIGSLKVTSFELYKLDMTNNPGADIGVAHIDPSDPGFEEDKNKDGNFLRLERNIDYTLSEDLGYIRLRTRSLDEILGCHYVLTDRISEDTVMTIGHGVSLNDSTLSLKMIKPQSPHPNHPTWDLMFKNVYYLGTTNINPEGFAVRIVNDRLTPPSDRDPLGIPYLNQFGLDSLNENGSRQPYVIIDMNNPNIVNLIAGELHFPALLPFVSEDSLFGGNMNEILSEVLGEGKMYTSTISTDYNGDSRFTIEADYSNQSSTINLGFMLVEGSEEVLLNGIRLTRGIDYQIDYFSGTIVLGETAADPNASVRILYDKHELVSFDKKVILGARAQMDFGDNSFLGATALFYDQSVINKKIEVGYEPTRNFIWDLNGRFEFDLDGLTRILDKLPIIETEKLSTLSVEGEFAQVWPNPNPVNNAETGDPNGVAFIDDFEGAKRTTYIPVQRRQWKASSAPVDTMIDQVWPQRYRARMYWYNPFEQVWTKDIWPNQSTSQLAHNEKTDILVLNHKRLSNQINPDSIWSGITTSFYSGDYDQTQSKFFEIWLKGTEGELTVDLGKISEDMNDNGKLDTEDIPEAGLTLGNGFLEDHEDVGVDGCPDLIEDGWGGCLESGTYNSPGQNEINTAEEINPDDPNNDNWNYSEGSTNYSQVNGTEGNGTGSQIQEGGKYPDTEDLDRSGFLDKTDAYFTKTFPLDPEVFTEEEEDYLAGETEKDGMYTGWRLYRIPLIHFENINTVEWNEIRSLRLVWTGVENENTLQIAKMELVGNEWQELGIAPDSSSTFDQTGADSVFSIAIVNTEDNADYIPPKGVKGEYDPINEIQSKEQSLVLKFSNLEGGYKAAAKKTLYRNSGNSYLIYDRMKMYMYGTSLGHISDEETDIYFFLRFGLGDDYYEITQPVFEGWDEKEGRNSIDLDLSWLTKLKLQSEENIQKYRATDVFQDSAGVRKYSFTGEDGLPTGKEIILQGSPSLSRIQYFTVGITNVSNNPISGDVWIDELRLSGVKKDKGIAMRVQSKFNLADLGNTTLSYSRKDADFHILQQRLGSNSTTEDLRLNATLQLQKLLPKFLGISIPLNGSYSNTVNRPKYFPGTDVLVDSDASPDSILTKSEVVSLSTSVSKAGKSDNKLIKYTLDALKSNFNASRTKKSNEIMAEELHESYSGRLSYALSFGRNNYFHPLKWLHFLPWLGTKMSDIQLYYTPSSINTSVNFSEKLVQKYTRSGTKAPDDYNLGLNRSFGLDYKFLNNLTMKYNQTAKSDMDNYRGYIWMAIKELDPGLVTNVTENLTTSFSPELFTWLKPSFNYSAGYRWNFDRANDMANIGVQFRFTSNISISPSTIFELVYKPPKSKGSSGSRGRQRGRSDDNSKKEEESKKEGNSVLTFLHGMIGRIDPISFGYTENLNKTGNGILGTVPTGYKFGWLPDHGLPNAENVGTNTGNRDHKQDITFRSGLKLTKKTTLSLNFAENISTTISGSGVEQRSISRDYLAFGEKMDQGFPFVGWSMRISGLEKLPLIRKIAKTISLEHAFSGKETRSWQIEGQDIPKLSFVNLSTFISDYKEYEKQGKLNAGFSPLIGITMSLNKGISLNIRSNYNRSLDIKPSGLSLRVEKSWSASTSYSHKGGFTIPLPFTDDWNVDNNMNFTLKFDMNENETFASGNNVDLTQQAFTSGWKTGMRISYSFSRNVTGGIIYEYRESNSKTTGRKIDRDFGFDINIAISG